MRTGCPTVTGPSTSTRARTRGSVSSCAKALTGTEAILSGDKLTRGELKRYASAMAYYIVTDQANQLEFPRGSYFVDGVEFPR